MYLLFREKNWKPSDYYFLPPGEKLVVRAFFRQEADERKKYLDDMK